MVGEEVVKYSSDVNELQKCAGANGSLKPKDNFERSPHLKSRKTVNDRGTSCPIVKRQLLHLSEVYQGSSGYYREALRPVIKTLIYRLEART
jgi:hypothetical protein